MRLNWFCFALALLAAATLQVSCTRFKLNTAEMTPEEIVQRSTHLFIGAIENGFPVRCCSGPVRMIRLTGGSFACVFAWNL